MNDDLKKQISDTPPVIQTKKSDPNSGRVRFTRKTYQPSRLMESLQERAMEAEPNLRSIVVTRKKD